jgi:hypothetical protein
MAQSIGIVTETILIQIYFQLNHHFYEKNNGLTVTAPMPVLMAEAPFNIKNTAVFLTYYNDLAF